MSYPAPEVLSDDPWFGPAPETERSVELKQILISEQILEEEHYEEYTEKPVTIKEPENIHEVLYQMATENVATTLSLNPLPTFGGGSELSRTVDVGSRTTFLRRLDNDRNYLYNNKCCLFRFTGTLCKPTI